MSHRVTTKTEVKDSVIAKQALKHLNMNFREEGDNIFITSGNLRGAVLNLKTGDITGDTDYGHSRNSLAGPGGLAQVYGEFKCKAEIMKEGHTITSRRVEGEDVVLYCRMA